MQNPPLTVYELSLNVLVSWQAHSLSNEGADGSNKVMPRSQMLADGSVTDACSGSIAKHYHAVLLAEYLGIPDDERTAFVRFARSASDTVQRILPENDNDTPGISGTSGASKPWRAA